MKITSQKDYLFKMEKGKRKKISIDQIDDFIKECDLMQQKSATTAQRFKIVNYIFNTLILVGSASMTIDGFFNTESYILRVVVGLMMMLVQGLSTGLSIEKRGTVNKTISIKFRKLSRKLKQLSHLNASEMDINNTLIRAYQEFDDLDITMYSNDNIIEFSRNSPV